jgi:hypothetical protein
MSAHLAIACTNVYKELELVPGYDVLDLVGFVDGVLLYSTAIQPTRSS